MKSASPVKSVYTKPTAQILQHTSRMQFSCLHCYNLLKLDGFFFNIQTLETPVFGVQIWCGGSSLEYIFGAVRVSGSGFQKGTDQVFSIGQLYICFWVPLALISSVFCGKGMQHECLGELVLQDVGCGWSLGPVQQTAAGNQLNLSLRTKREGAE